VTFSEVSGIRADALYGIIILQNRCLIEGRRRRIGGNPEFGRRKVEVSSDESLTLLGGKSEELKRG